MFVSIKFKLSVPHSGAHWGILDFLNPYFCWPHLSASLTPVSLSVRHCPGPQSRQRRAEVREGAEEASQGDGAGEL